MSHEELGNNIQSVREYVNENYGNLPKSDVGRFSSVAAYVHGDLRPRETSVENEKIQAEGMLRSMEALAQSSDATFAQFAKKNHGALEEVGQEYVRSAQRIESTQQTDDQQRQAGGR